MSAPVKTKRLRGAALVLVMLLLSVLGVVTAEFLYELRIYTVMQRNHEGKVRARYVAKAGQNAAGILVRKPGPENEEIWNNQFVSLFRYSCMEGESFDDKLMTFQQADQSAVFEDEEEEDREDDRERAEEDSTGFYSDEMENCGRWSLWIPYVLDDVPLEIEITSEQARINVNALVKIASLGEEGVSVQPNRFVFNMLFELIMLQAVRHNIMLTEVEVREMVENLYGYMNPDPFADQKLRYFDYGDKIISMKGGPLDSLEEIRYLPLMDDELYDAIKEFLTVYPMGSDNFGNFDDRINVNAAPVEVIYAMVRALSYGNTDRDPETSPEEALQIATEIVTRKSLNTAQPPPQAIPGVQPVVPYQRDTTALQQYPAFATYNLLPQQKPRYYRIRSLALPESGFETVITRVVRFDAGTGKVDVFYYRED